MKKAILLFLGLSTLFISCDKNDDNAVDNQQAVLKGKWEVKSYTAEATLNGQPLPEEDVDFSGVVGTIFEFGPGNKFSATTYDDFDEQWGTETGTYVYHPSENKIMYTFTESDGSLYTETMNVKLLNQTNFNFNIISEEVDEGDVYKLSMDVNCEKKN